MSANVILAIAFINLLVGGLGRKVTQAGIVGLFVYLASHAAYISSLPGGIGSYSPDEVAMFYGVIGSFLLWSVVWSASWVKALV